MSGLLDYLPGDSLMHRLNPLTKLLVAFGLCAACFATSDVFAVLFVIALNIAMSASAGAVAATLRTLFALVKFSLPLFVLQILFVRQGEALLPLPLGVTVTDVGLKFSLLFAARLVAAALPLTLMLSVTRIGDISNALVSKLRVPYKYAFALTTAIRFIPLFSSEMTGIIEAQKSRGVEFETKNFFKKVALLLPLCAPLLISSVRKIEGSTISAELRGFNFRGNRSGYKAYPFALADYAAVALCAAVVAGCAVFSGQ